MELQGFTDSGIPWDTTEESVRIRAALLTLLLYSNRVAAAAAVCNGYYTVKYTVFKLPVTSYAATPAAG